jgi:hypothetical protein
MHRSGQRATCVFTAMHTAADFLSGLASSAAKKFTFRLLRMFSEKREVLHMEVWMMANTEKVDEVFGKLQSALTLLSDTDRLRFRRVQRHLKRIVIADNTGAVYVPELQACMLGLSYVEESTSARLASAILHEATHARMRNVGVPYSPNNWGREEKRCVA